jgi:hypothetical protein
VRDKNEDIVKHLDTERNLYLEDILHDIRHEWQDESSRTSTIFNKFRIKETAPKREASKKQQDSLRDSETKP